jgi:outer membrane autotransporter protein
MGKSKQPQLRALTLALTAALASMSMAPTAAQADQTITTANGPVVINLGASDNITVTGSGVITAGMGINNSGNIGTLNNGGAISGSSDGIVNNAGATIGTLNNSGAISGSSGINQTGIIGTLNNSGTISSLINAGMNITGGTINALNNNSGGVFRGAIVGIASTGVVTVLTNNNGGTISGGTYGINNYLGTIGTLTNNGAIAATVGVNGSSNYGIVNTSTITTLNNSSSGTIHGNYGIYNYKDSQSGSIGTIGTLTNAGDIGGGSYGVLNNTVIGILNNSGTIRGSSYALYNAPTASLATFTNAGTIAGTVRNDAPQDLTINGGTGSTFGTLTGFSGATGILMNTASNLIFGSGNQLLNDNVNVTGHSAINSAGTLQLNNRIAITGNYSQAAAATLAIGVADNAVAATNLSSGTGYGRLVVSGSATIASGSAVALKQLNSYGFAQGQRYLVVQAAAGGTNYNAGSLVYTVPGYTVTGASVVDGGNLDLLLTLGEAIPTAPDTPPATVPDTPIITTPNNPATASNAASSLASLFKYNGTDAKLMDLFNAATTLGSPEAANRAGAQLSPAANVAAATQAAAAPTAAVLNVTAGHIDSLRTTQTQGNSGVSSGESGRDVALWGQAFGGRATQGERDGISGYSAGYNGLLLGADTMAGDNWRIGGLFSYANTSVADSGDNTGSSTHVMGYGLIGYAGYAGKGWYMDLSGGAVQQQYDTTRSIDFGGFSGNAVGQHNGLQYVASIQGGVPIRLDSLMADTTLTPIAGMSYSTLRQSGYAESGGNGAALNVGASVSTSLKSDLGAQLERIFSTAYGPLTPSAQFIWRHEYRDTRLQSVANFAADTSGATSFTTQGPTPVANTGVLALGLTLMRSQNLKLSARYTLETGGGYTAQTADVHLRYQF